MMLTTAIFDFGGVLTTDLWESIRGGAQRRGLPRDAILGYLHGAGRDRFHALERGDIDQVTFESGAAEARLRDLAAALPARATGTARDLRDRITAGLR